MLDRFRIGQNQYHCNGAYLARTCTKFSLNRKLICLPLGDPPGTMLRDPACHRPNFGHWASNSLDCRNREIKDLRWLLRQGSVLSIDNSQRGVRRCRGRSLLTLFDPLNRHRVARAALASGPGIRDALPGWRLVLQSMGLGKPTWPSV